MLKNSVTADAIRLGLENHLAPVLDQYRKRLRRYTQPKILRDVIWGFNRFAPHELALIDSPLFQRLRNIFQTSLAAFTYPCAVHSRFEHSLGAAVVASRMAEAAEKRVNPGLISPALKLEARLASLLHDLGHGPCSHSSERFYERLADDGGAPIFGPRSSLVEENRTLFAEASASEILTFLLITTHSFQQLWEKIRDMYSDTEPALASVDLKRMASMILGVDAMVGGGGRFYQQIVNGPFDADKLDYLPRDGYFTGLQLVVDIDRLLHTVTVIVEGDKTDLGVVVGGSSVLEQVIFAKSQLFMSVYHHQKVRAAHQLLQRLLRVMCERDCKPAGKNLRDPVSYVILDDYDLFHSMHGVPDIDSIVRKIKDRDLPRRALVIAYPCFQEEDRESRENFDKLDTSQLDQIEQQVERELRLPKGDVMFDIPDMPRLLGTAQAKVQIAPDQTLPLQKIYPAGAWGTAYAGYRKVAYVFTTASDARRVGIAVRSALGNLRYPINLNDNALTLAKC